LLINLMFLMLPMFLAQVFWIDRPNRKPRRSSIALGLIGGVTAFFCMMVPFHLTSGYFLDLRMVPLAICLMYGGYSSGLITASIIMMVRLYQGGPGVPSSFFVVACAFLGYMVISRRLPKWTSPNKIIAAVALSLWLSAATLTYAWMIHSDIFYNSLHIRLSLQFAAIQGTATWIITYFIEIIIKNTALRGMLEQSKKMQLVSELAASVSHEVRNPLTVTRGFIQMLKNESLSSEKRTAYIHLALEELDRAESIISDFLNFAKPQLRRLEALDVLQEIRSTADIMTPYATMNQVNITLTLEEGCLVQGEKDKFRQCLVNLAKNAIEAMPEGGTLSFTAGREQAGIVIRVMDTGAGMTKEQVDRLGTPYYSTKDKGTGLGTMVAFSIIQAMKGRISITSSIGKGTCFTITFHST
jgi:two-component system, sporulation sensor kinase B